MHISPEKLDPVGLSAVLGAGSGANMPLGYRHGAGRYPVW